MSPAAGQAAVTIDAGAAPAAETAPALATAPCWALLHSNRAAWAAAKAILASAQESIAIEQFIFSHRGIGLEILDILADRARQGVRVRLLADWFGSRPLAASAGARALVAAGGEVAIFHPPRGFLRHPSSAFHRLHRKTLIVDGRLLMTGGSCFAPRMEDWRDTMALIEHEVAAEALAEFDVAWAYAAEGTRPLPVRARARAPDGRTWSFVVSSPYRQSRGEYDTVLFDRIAHAEHSVILTSPYLVPVGRFWRVMERATRRGVRVRVMIPARSDQPLTDIFSFRYARRLLGRGVEVYGYTGGMMHAKLAAIDGDWAAVGSFNLGIDSIRMNLEGALVSRDRGFHAALLGQLEADLATSRPL
ncbi:phospholipase D-like domain-containing protein [Devosia sp.]|uniref:phospholipase D-like domain-containing protein n=1 Tax=Devosia sp. TaxID=1871048 RepID=UPI0037504FD2